MANTKAMVRFYQTRLSPVTIVATDHDQFDGDKPHGYYVTQTLRQTFDYTRFSFLSDGPFAGATQALLDEPGVVEMTLVSKPELESVYDLALRIIGGGGSTLDMQMLADKVADLAENAGFTREVPSDARAE